MSELLKKFGRKMRVGLLSIHSYFYKVHSILNNAHNQGADQRIQKAFASSGQSRTADNPCLNRPAMTTAGVAAVEQDRQPR